MLELIGRLLSELNRSPTLRVCPGDWAWTTSVAGVVFAVLPVLGAMLIAALRRRTGNRYDAGPLVAFAVIGFLLVGALPLWMFSATSEVFRGAARGVPVGLSDPAGTLGLPFCPDGVPQVSYLGEAVSVWSAVGGLSGTGVRTALAGLIAIGAPLLVLMFVWLQGRAAFRRGPKWPARLFWLPVLLLAFGTAPLSVTVVAHLWLGFVPAAMVGVFVVLLVGAPSRSVIDAERRRDRPRPVSPAPAQAGPLPRAQRPGGPPAWPPPAAARQPRSQQPVPPQGGTGRSGWPLPPTLVVPDASLAQPAPFGQAFPTEGGGRTDLHPALAGQADRPSGSGGRLAADPGPLPGTLQQAIATAAAAAPGNAAAVSPADSADQPTTSTGPPAHPAHPADPADPGEPSETTEPVGAAGEQTTTLPGPRFQRIRRLGTGGFGQVWLAMDTKLGRTVAVKVATAHSAETEQRIQREARALAAVHHPNCVRIYDIVDDIEAGGLAIVMEYVPGRPLGEVVAERRLTDPTAARLWHTLAGALHAAHGKGVLHRDVKPSNIIIAEDGAPRLIDFGIARAAGDVTLTAAGLVVGTPDFLPPEIAAGGPPTPASDAWQLAAAVSFALTGVPPRGHVDGAVAAMLAAARGEPCNQLPAGSTLRRLLERSLAPNPLARPTLPAVQAELLAWLR